MFFYEQQKSSRFFGTVFLTTQPEFYMFKVNNRNTKNTRARCQICLKLTLRTLMTLISYFYCKLSSNFTHSSGISIVTLDQVHAGSVHVLFILRKMLLKNIRLKMVKIKNLQKRILVNQTIFEGKYLIFKTHLMKQMLTCLCTKCIQR